MLLNRFDYDVVIVGSGVGGLTAGAYLAKWGVRVLICEQHCQPGGCFTSFKRKGYTFDGGIHACEDAGMLFPMLEQLGIVNQLPFKKSSFALVLPDFFCKLQDVTDLGKFYRHLAGVFPGEALALERLAKESLEFCRLMEAFWKAPNPLYRGWKKTLREFPSWLWKNGYELKSLMKFLRLFRIPVEEYLETIIRDRNLVNLLAQMSYRGCPASFFLPYIYYMMNYYYPARGGIQAIPNLLAQFIENKGGEIRYNTRVIRILVENGTATGVETEKGEIIRSRFVVNNSDARRTYFSLLSPEATSSGYRQRLSQAELSESMFGVFLGVKIPPQELPSRARSHILIFPTYNPPDYGKMDSDPDYYRKSLLLLSIPSLEDESLAPPGRSVMILTAAASPRWQNGWLTRDGERTPEYQALKEEVANQLIANAEMVIPDLAKNIELKITGSPFTYERFTLNSGGASAGWSYHPRKTFVGGKFPTLAYRTPIKNLFQVGHWAMYPGGAPAGFLTGRVVSGIIRRKLRG